MTFVLIGQAASHDDLAAFEAIEESQPEGTLMLAELLFDAAADEVSHLAARLNTACLEHGVTPWPGANTIAYADQSTLRIQWQKGLSWWGWILGTLLTLVLPTLIGAALWAMLPESIKQLIQTVMYLGVMALVVWGMSKMIKTMTKETKEMERT